VDPDDGRSRRLAALVATLALIGVATWLSVTPSSIGVLGQDLSKVRDTCAAAAAALVALGLPAAQLAFNFGDEFSDRANTLMQAGFVGKAERDAAVLSLEQTYRRYLYVVISLWNIYLWASGSLLLCLFGMAEAFKGGTIAGTGLDRVSILAALWMLTAAIAWAIPLLWHALSTRAMALNLRGVTASLRRGPPAAAPSPAAAAAPAVAPAAGHAPRN
jgi:hypothetical protein